MFDQSVFERPLRTRARTFPSGVMAASKTFDYRVDELEKEGRVVDGFRVGGLLAELCPVIHQPFSSPAP